MLFITTTSITSLSKLVPTRALRLPAATNSRHLTADVPRCPHDFAVEAQDFVSQATRSASICAVRQSSVRVVVPLPVSQPDLHCEDPHTVLHSHDKHRYSVKQRLQPDLFDVHLGPVLAQCV